MALSNIFRSATTLFRSSKSSLSESASVSRGFDSTGMKRIGGGHGRDSLLAIVLKYNSDSGVPNYCSKVKVDWKGMILVEFSEKSKFGGPAKTSSIDPGSSTTHSRPGRD